MSTTAPDKLLTAKEAADRLNVSEGTLRVWRCSNRYHLPFVRLGNGKAIRYRREDVERFIAESTVTPAEID